MAISEARFLTVGSLRSLDPLSPRTNIFFVLAATTLFSVIVVLANNDLFIWNKPGAARLVILQILPTWWLNVFRMWVMLAVVLGMLLPLAVLLVWGRSRVVRATLLPYVGVLLVQVLMETIFGGLLLNINPFIGFVYTAYRVWQLHRAHLFVASVKDSSGYGRAALRVTLSLGILFWSVNLLFLIATITVQLI